MRMVMTACVVLGLAGSAWGQPAAGLRGDFEAVAGGKPAGAAEAFGGARSGVGRGHRAFHGVGREFFAGFVGGAGAGGIAA